MHRDLFNAALTLRQRFGLHRAVDLMSNTLSANGLHIYGLINEKAANVPPWVARNLLC